MTVDSNIIAIFQTAFNLFTAILLIPFTNQLVNLSVMIVKEAKEDTIRHPELHTLVENLYISPAVAMAEATKAVAAMGKIARDNFKKCTNQLLNYNEALNEEIDADEACLDQFADSSDHFLIGLSKVIESEVDDRQLDLLLQTVPSFERVGDYGTNLVELAQRLKKENASLSESALRELSLLCDAVNEVLATTVYALEHDDMEAAKTIEPLEETIDDMVMLLRDRHTKRLKNGTCSVTSGLVFMETLTHIERTSDHCSSIAVMMLARTNPAILHNHYEYLREIHTGNDSVYRNERNRRREQYILPLKEMN